MGQVYVFLLGRTIIDEEQRHLLFQYLI